MKDSPNPSVVNPLDSLVELIADRVAAKLQTKPAPPRYITTAEALKMYDMGKEALRSRGIPCVKRGRSWVWDVDAIELHLKTHAAPRPPRKSRPIPLENEDPIDAMLRHGELRATKGNQ